MTEQNSEKLVADYRELYNLHQSFTDNVTQLVSSLLQLNNIQVLSIEKRTKTIDSFQSKITRPSKIGKYSTVTDITDLSGVRIIVFYENDAIKARNIIQINFVIDIANSIDKASQLSPDRFGYLSDHYVVSHLDSRNLLDEYSQYNNLKAEIQIRTAVQHAWAVIDRNLRYNNESDIPIEVKRKLFRVSALLELADKEFSSISEKINSLREVYSESIPNGSLDFGINCDSIQVFISKAYIVKEISVAAQKAGLQLTYDHKYEGFGSNLSTVALNYGLKTIKELSEFLELMKPKLPDLLKQIESDYNTQRIVRAPDEAIIADLLIFYDRLKRND